MILQEKLRPYRLLLASHSPRRQQLLRDCVGRPCTLYLAHRLSEKYGCRIYLKRGDLNHTEHIS